MTEGFGSPPCERVCRAGADAATPRGRRLSSGFQHQASFGSSIGRLGCEVARARAVERPTARLQPLHHWMNRIFHRIDGVGRALNPPADA